ncbi:hypothetical protein DLM75_19600 [Leptospira stimsonii]|uniref:Uncharacterized protein n=1 Tax=Leptospira stimsonii TaxID=2202203 RepID=A0A396YWJ6_9LEPT|nr:hypothetical protein DLM75_19600 [Leptospira stimsonii]
MIHSYENNVANESWFGLLSGLKPFDDLILIKSEMIRNFMESYYSHIVGLLSGFFEIAVLLLSAILSSNSEIFYLKSSNRGEDLWILCDFERPKHSFHNVY